MNLKMNKSTKVGKALKSMMESKKKEIPGVNLVSIASKLSKKKFGKK